MENLFTPHTRESAVDTVINSIKLLLLERKLLPGDRLPSELEISKGLGVSRGSVREAMKILSAFDIVDVRVGDGTYIVSTPKKNLIDPLLFSFLLSKPDISALSEFREYIELDIVELAMKHKPENEEVLVLLEENLRDLERLRERSQSTLREYVDNDLTFHRLLGKSCCNQFLEKVYSFILEYFAHSIAMTHENQTRGEQSYTTHMQIMKGIRSNNFREATAAINKSVQVWKNLQPKNSKM